MGNKSFTLDMTMMFAVHDALRRELDRMARVTADPTDDPRRVLRTAVGWEMFKKYLHVHHTSEDDAVWPVMFAALEGRPDDLAVLTAMEAEHAAIDPLMVAIDSAVFNPDADSADLGALVDALRTGVTDHLRHEESDGLALIDSTLTGEQWKNFSEVHRDRIGKDSVRYLPWLLDDASDEALAGILGKMPPPLKAAYADEWRTAYLNLDIWGAKDDAPTH